ncbi:hypothetical protein HPB47_012324 [Ixodes persulcatus]|uniref:Uncharacterized protein n=1 Tax=Ixodes persulcatus TaxID=34615 RepID=A0AC60NTU1_IXOPE|nr:hypothetical protein HPB47_012324 [Ixodes persulcatus]
MNITVTPRTRIWRESDRKGGDVSRAEGSKNFEEGRKAPREPRRKGPKERELPRDDIKIIMRPRNGLNLRKCSPAEILNGVRRAAGMEASQAEHNVLRINAVLSAQEKTRGLRELRSLRTTGGRMPEGSGNPTKSLSQVWTEYPKIGSPV